MQNINETKLARVWQHWTNPERAAALLTAFRGEYDLSENLKRNRALAADIRAAGYGFVFVEGHWIENQGTNNERNVEEDSLLVNAPAADFSKFRDTILQLGAKFEQEAVIIKSPSGDSNLYVNGASVQDLGQLHPEKMGQAYTQLRRSKKNTGKTFVFDDVRHDVGFLQRLAGITVR
jgi:hypothetical protein